MQISSERAVRTLDANIINGREVAIHVRLRPRHFQVFNHRAYLYPAVGMTPNLE